MTVEIDVKSLGPKSLAIAVSADEEVCVKWHGRTLFDSEHGGLAVPGDDEDYEEDNNEDEDYQDYQDEDEDNDIHITFADEDDIFHTVLILRLL